jgi:hypothetical protein
MYQLSRAHLDAIRELDQSGALESALEQDSYTAPKSSEDPSHQMHVQ